MWFGLHRHTWVDVTSAMALNITNRLTKYKLLDNQSRTLAGEAMKSTNVRKRQRKRCTIWQICSVSFVARMESSQIRPRSTFVLWLAWPSCLRKHINVRKPWQWMHNFKFKHDRSLPNISILPNWARVWGVHKVHNFKCTNTILTWKAMSSSCWIKCKAKTS